MSLADHVSTLGRGPGRSRSLTLEEAAQAMQIMLSDTAEPAAIGALLMLLRMKGETAAEIAGLASAAQAALPAMPQVDLDWPSYAAGRTRGAPWFLISARQIADEGHRVLLHGWNGRDPKVRAGLATAGIQMARTPDQAALLLDRDRIAYLPLEETHPALFRLLRLRDVLGLRSCINTVCRMLNPAAAAASVQGVFHPSYRLLQADAAALLGWHALTVIKGGGGEFERNPSKPVEAFGLRAGTAWEATLPPTVPHMRRLAEPTGDTLPRRWTQRLPDAFERQVIAATYAAARSTLGLAVPCQPPSPSAA